MEQTLDDILTINEDDQEQADLRRAEAALAGCESLDTDLEAALTALIWRRTIRSPRGMVNCLISPDSLARLDRIAEDLDLVGAEDAADRFRELRDACPLSDRQLGPGLIDWLDTNLDFAREAERLERDMPDIGPEVLAFLRARMSACADISVPPEKRGFFSRLFG